MDENIERFMVSGIDIDGEPVKGFPVYNGGRWMVIEAGCLYENFGHHMIDLKDVSPVVNPATMKSVSKPPDLLGITEYICPNCGSVKMSLNRFCRECGQRISE